MGTYVITGGASGIGAAIKGQLQVGGPHGTGGGPAAGRYRGRPFNTGGQVRSGRRYPGSPPTANSPDWWPAREWVRMSPIGTLITAVNYFGAVELVEGLRQLLSDNRASVLLVSSNSAPMPTNPDFVQALLSGDESAACAIAARWNRILCIPVQSRRSPGGCVTTPGPMRPRASA